MTLSEILKLEKNDGVFWDEYEGIVSSITRSTLHGSSVLQLEISYIWNDKVIGAYPIIYLDFPDCVHNRVIFRRLKTWDPFGLRM